MINQNVLKKLRISENFPHNMHWINNKNNYNNTCGLLVIPTKVKKVTRKNTPAGKTIGRQQQ